MNDHTPESDKKPLYITQPFLPPIEEFLPCLEQIWGSKILTNNGPFHKQFEEALCEYLGVKHLSLLTNGTTALMTALQALRVKGEVITTPYTFVATAHSLLWNNIKPVFVDIDPITYNIDPNRIEAAITPRTTAILPVHCYGTSCNVEEIKKIADNYGLKVIYDAAHAFGVKRKGRSILEYGDLSVLSFHATKIFNTFEGGAVICPDLQTKQHVDHLKNFGFSDEVTVVAPGINGKMNEFSSALGLIQIKYIDQAIRSRQRIDAKYREIIGSIRGISMLTENQEESRNYSYFPVFIKKDFPISRDELYIKFKKKNINVRRYFYPLVSDFPIYHDLTASEKDCFPVAMEISESVICLPIYPGLEDEEIINICAIITEA